VLQLNVFDRDGQWIARVDMAWPSRRVIIEVDGREHHETPEAVLRDRDKQNRLAGAGWTLLRFTWSDIVRQPAYVIARVRAALSLAA
jgi:very-short-patch-repair endonuclease